MKKTIKTFQIILSLLSAFVIFLIAGIGDCMSNLLSDVFGYTPMPVITEYAMVLFRLNNGNFSSAISPFIVLFLSLPIFLHLSPKVKECFWYVFVTLWLLVGAFLGVVILGVSLGFMILMTKMDDPHIVETIIKVANFTTISVVVTSILILAIKKYKRTEQSH